MTTIAYRKGMLAADTGSYPGRMGEVIKIAKYGKFLAGACGNATYLDAFLKWFLGGREGKSPEPKSDSDGCDRGVIFGPKLTDIEIFEPGGSFKMINCPYFAMGSGRQVALGAMHAGANARQAVFAAMTHDDYTWGAVTELHLGKRP